MAKEKGGKMHEALGIFLEAMRLYTIAFLENHFPAKNWEDVFYSVLNDQQQRNWEMGESQGTQAKNLIDYSNLTFFTSKYREVLDKELGGMGKSRELGNCISSLKGVRDKSAHYIDVSEDDVDLAFASMKKAAGMLGMTELREKIAAMERGEGETPTVKEEPDPEPEETAATGNSDAWFDVCEPHYDIRSGKLGEATFAANLRKVVTGTAAEEYNNADVFFKKTYVTEGMRGMLNGLVRALNGEEGGNRVVSLQTGFGGGKTHILISLYHLARGGRKLAEKLHIEGMATPKFEQAKVAVFTNDTTDVTCGRKTFDGITVHTLWGEIAYQIGGKEGYESVRESDEELIAPAAEYIETILERAGASLILIDELADYCVRAAARKTVGSNLYMQTVSFLQTLTEVVASVPRCMLVVTLTASKQEVGGTEQGEEILDALQRRLRRYAASVKPVDDMEVYEVVRRRLFERVGDESTVSGIVKKYLELYKGRRKYLPGECVKPEYREKMERAYPFHPELIDVLRLRWGGINKFQRTRGVLKMLALVVWDLYNRKESLREKPNLLIHTSDVCLKNLPAWTSMVTELEGRGWESVMSADVYGSNSAAAKLDADGGENSTEKYDLAQGVAGTLLMASVGSMQRKGLSIKELKLCLLRPNAFRHGDVDTVLNGLDEKACYLYSSKGEGEKSYWFETRPNVNVWLRQMKEDVKDGDIDEEIRVRLKRSTKGVTQLKVIVCPTDEVDEQRRLTLVIMDPQYSDEDGELEKKVKCIAEKRGNGDRIVRNTIFYLACNGKKRMALREKVKEYLAYTRIEKEYGESIDGSQKEVVERKIEECDEEAENALAQAYSVALRYTKNGGISRAQVNDCADNMAEQIEKNLMRAVGSEGEDWVIGMIGNLVLEKNNLLPTKEKPIKVRDVYEAFLNYDDKQMITGTEAVRVTVNRLCREGRVNVAFGKDESGGYEEIYEGRDVPSLEVESEKWWMVDTSVRKERKDAPVPDDATDTTPTTNPTGGTDPKLPDVEPVKVNKVRYKRMVVSGSVGTSNWSLLFGRFVNPLRHNEIEIELRVTAKTTPDHPLDSDSQTVREVMESARQMGFNVEKEPEESDEEGT